MQAKIRKVKENTLKKFSQKLWSISINHLYALLFFLFIIFNTFIIFIIEHNLIETYTPFIPLYKQNGPSGLYLFAFLHR